MTRKILAFMRENPVPFLAFFGLVLGAAARFLFNRSDVADILWLATLLIGGAPVVFETVRGMLHGDFASDVVAMLAILTAIFMGEYFAGVIIVIMQSGGEALESYSLRRASSSLEELLARAPRSAHRRVGDEVVDIEVGQVVVGDVLLVRSGDLIPVDGELLAESAEVDEAALTGEPLTRPKAAGDVLMSGSVNMANAFEMRATHLAADSQYSRIVDLVRKAQEEKPPLQRMADRYAVWFTPVTLVMCALGWLITGRPETILSVLVVATPCPLILAVPVAVIGGINRAAAAGIVVKGGTAIEQIGRAQAIVFDKTGTLTYGTPSVNQVITVNGYSAEEMLRLAGSVEQNSSHPLGQSIATAARQAGSRLSTPTQFQEVAGHGVEAEVDGHHVQVGSLRYLGQGNDMSLLGTATGEMTTYIAIDGKPAGRVTFHDQLRPGVADLMHELRAMGIQRTIMLTGDSAEHAEVVAKAIGIDEVQADLLPEDKLRIVKALETKYGSVVMVGDGINDAPALAGATVGVAMGAHGTGISAEAADIVLLVDDVRQVAYAVEAGQRMRRIALQSIYVGLGLSLTLMVIAALGFIQPAVGALFQEVIDVVVILNALRARG